MTIDSSALKSVSGHFKFGENWKSYASLIQEREITEAIRGMKKLISEEDLAGKTFLDVGCGSGLSMLAALKMGAASVRGIDIDPVSVETARAVLEKFAPRENWRLDTRSVFDLSSPSNATPSEGTMFDVVYSWGVLHHTGEMWQAITKTSRMVKHGGLLVISLYHETPLCSLWRAEKRFYAHASAWQQWLLRVPYKAAYILRIAASGANPYKFISNYKNKRGMDWHHDVHDWLGGYPYESALPSNIVPYLKEAGFAIERVFENCSGGKGLFGTGCDEYVARRES